MDQLAAVSQDIRNRIFASIEHLYDGLGRGERFPTVSAIRAHSRTDMNSCAIVAREWRRQQQSVRPTPIAAAIPEAVMHAHQEAAAMTWAAAQELANGSLRDAESRWEHERADSDAMRLELSDAFESASGRAEEAEARLAEVVETNRHLQQQNTDLTDQLAALREALVEQRSRADEIEHRANDLKAELGIAHEGASAVRQELSQARLAHISEMEQFKSAAANQLERLNESLATTRTRLESTTEQANGLRTSLDDTHAQLVSAKARIEAVDAIHQSFKNDAAKSAHKEAERFVALQKERDLAVEVAASSKQDLARVAGILEAVQAQNVQLLARFPSPQSKGN